MSVTEHIDRILDLAGVGLEGERAQQLREEIEHLVRTERRRAERTSVVAMSEEDAVRYRAISELASDFVYAVRIDDDARIRFEWADGNFERLTGYTQQEVNEGEGWLGIIHPDDRDVFQNPAGPISRRQPTTLEYRVITRTGEERWFRDHACPEIDAAGERVIRIFGAVKDVTRELHAQEALRETMKRLEQRVGFDEARFRSVLDQAGEAIYMIDPADGSFIDVNETACRMLGFTRSELLAMNMYDIEVGEPRWMKREQSKVLRKRGLSTETYHRHKSGATFPVETAVSVRRYAGRDYLLVTAREITERKQMEVQLAQADRLASVGILAAGVAHEVNNPLVYILNNISFVLSELPSDYQELRDALNEARSGAERVRDIVQDLKTFARSEERFGPIDVRELLDTSIKLAFNEIRFRARLERDYQEDVPLVKASDRLGQVFLNLLTNAAHSIKEGSAASQRILVSVRYRSGRVAVSFEDTGSGIPAAELGKIFDPFFTTKPVGMGTGLGLSICRNITQSLGGDIEVESVEGRGTKFTVWLPAIADGTRVNERPSSMPPPSFSSMMSVLVVDDDPFVGRAISRLLRARHSVTLAKGGAEALKLLENRSFDVILCDVMMPSMTGMELYQEVQRRDPRAASRFVFITGGAFTPEARSFLAESNTPCLQKPFSPKELTQALEQVVSARESTSESGEMKLGSWPVSV